MKPLIEDWVKAATSGDKDALEKIVIEIQDHIYNLALSMLWHPEDAKDATQEVLIKVITHLGSFRYKSSFKTWVYRVASNTLINYRQKYMKHSMSFDEFGTQLKQGLSDSIDFTTNETEQKLLVMEAKIGCSNAMLQCLDRKSRLTYILGEILEFHSRQGAEILGISPANFRQKLARARNKIHRFLHQNCGIINSQNPCRCAKKVDNSIAKGRIRPNELLFVRDGRDTALIHTIESIENEVALFQTNPTYNAPDQLIKEVKKIISTSDI
ncbi:MAG: RNA polymerase sigma factor [Bacteroidetes bacterium]|nr:MAG: RNA polymerase sigma factor [Bacteroidota bacterium]